MAKRITTAVAVVLNKNGHMLIVKNTKAGKWTLPGGQIDKGESNKQAVIREVFEETTVKIKVKKKSVTTKRYSVNNKKCAIVYLATANTKKVKLSHEHTEYMFVPAKKAMKKLIGRHSTAIKQLVK